MAKRHRMTPKRKAALRKAQLASARKRKGKGKAKPAAVAKGRSNWAKVGGHLRKHGGTYLAAGVLAGYSFNSRFRNAVDRTYVKAMLAGGERVNRAMYGRIANQTRRLRHGEMYGRAHNMPQFNSSAPSRTRHVADTVTQRDVLGKTDRSTGVHPRNVTQHKPPQAKPREFPYEGHLRRARKAGDVAMYEAGLPSAGSGTKAIPLPSGPSGRKFTPIDDGKGNAWNQIHPNVQRRILRNNRRRNEMKPIVGLKVQSKYAGMLGRFGGSPGAAGRRRRYTL